MTTRERWAFTTGVVVGGIVAHSVTLAIVRWLVG